MSNRSIFGSEENDDRAEGALIAVLFILLYTLVVIQVFR